MLRRSVKWKWVAAALVLVAAALVLVAAAIVVPVALPPDRNRNEGASTVTSCGGKRWPVKTLADPKTGGSMIAELPALSCTVGATRRARLLMQSARVAFLRACGDPGAGDYAEYGRRSQATVTGMGFFDFSHGQRGVAPNAIELHPVIGFAGRCKPPERVSSGG